MKNLFGLLKPGLLTLALLLCGCEKMVTEYQYVDLGLSVKWAKVNVGAARAMDPGAFFSWGELATKVNFTAENYKWFDENEKITKYCSNESYDNPDFLTVLETADDAAAMLWGKGWRMPTEEEFSELVNNCSWVWSSLDGVKGYKVSSKVPGFEDRYIFLPAAGISNDDGTFPGYEGYYWSSTNCGGNNSRQSECLCFKKASFSVDGIVRTVGASIRPVHE